MIVLGALLLSLGLGLKTQLFWIIGAILLVVGAVMWVMGSVGRPVGGRRYWY